MSKIKTRLFGELSMLPHPAQVPIRETLEFLTDVMESYNGKEQRLQLRTKARQTFEYTLPLHPEDMAAAFNAEYDGIRKRWAVPVWSEAQSVGNVLQGASSITCDTTNFDLRPNSLALLFANYGSWQVVEIDTIEANLLRINGRFISMGSAWLMPVRLGWIADSINKTTTGSNGTSQITFEIEDTLQIAENTPPQYQNNDIYYYAPLLDGSSGSSLSGSISKRLDKNDFDLGIVENRTTWANARFSRNLRSLAMSAAEIRQYKSFVYRRAGKFRSFWFPSFEVNLRPLNLGIITNTLVIASDAYPDSDKPRLNIAIQTLNGNWLLRTISNPVPINSTSSQVTLSAPLNISIDNIARISYLGLYRFDSDRIEINWIGNGIAETNVSIVELTP